MEYKNGKAKNGKLIETCKSNSAPLDFKEEWRRIDFPDGGGYLVSNTGKIKSLKGRVLSPYKRSNSNSLALTVCVNKKRVCVNVAQAVYKAFGTRYQASGRPKIMYRDGDYTNTAIYNLFIAEGYTKAPSPEQVETYIARTRPVLLALVKEKNLNSYTRLDVDNIIGDSLLLIWKHLSQYKGKYYYSFCKRYFDWCLRTALKQRWSDINYTISFDEMYIKEANDNYEL